MSESIINKNTSLDLFDMTEIKKTNYNEKKSEIKIERHDTSTPENPNLHKLTTENCKLHLQVKLLSQNLENIKDGKMIGLEKLDEFQNIQNIALKQENIQLSNTKIRLETINEQYKHEMEKLKAKVEEHKSKYIHSKNNFQCEVNKLSNTKLNQDKKIENLLEKLKSSELNCSKFDIKLKEVSQRLLLYESRLKHMSGMNPEQFDHPINSDSGFSGKKNARPTRKKKRRSFNNMNKLLERENVTVTNFDTNALSINIDRETTIKDAIKDLKLTDMKYWRSDQVLTWLTFDVGLPIYSQMCAGNIRSGKVLYGISEQELYIALGVSNNLHKRKIKMVLNEYKSMKTIKFLHSRDISVQYVNQIWLEEIGLPQFSQSFLAAAIDGRMLNTLTRKDLERHLGINRKPHYISILCGIQFLKSMDYNLEK
ncbi:hypothetical protein A3Q56_07176 [Intoshia linei]|uniref:SAM domain-containing protein n=1 Tax=Intoshia linei TaxID=1819745 RepID=A0A177AT01_9BILA|nr:hypothetical protein A3Q56_07176 [Intoshia linei]